MPIYSLSTDFFKTGFLSFTEGLLKWRLDDLPWSIPHWFLKFRTEWNAVKGRVDECFAEDFGQEQAGLRKEKANAK